MAERAVIVGIDEAGYGPVLGPLVVSATAFEVPAALADGCLWATLKSSVASKVPKRGGRLPIVDSKVLYQRAEGLGRLEKSVLAMVGAWRGLPPSFLALLRLVCPSVIASLDGYPWYAGHDAALPSAADLGAIRIAARRLTQDMAEQGVRVAGMWSEVVPEGEYNRQVEATDNKAVVLLGTTLRLVYRAAQVCPEVPVRIYVDKQGGRDYYARSLMRAFEERHLKIEVEGDAYSEYVLTGGGGDLRISFSEGGESRCMATALASMISKYLRELLMASFNAFWARHVPALKPTAGYYQDGQRFLRDIAPHLARVGVDAKWMVRAR